MDLVSLLLEAKQLGEESHQRAEQSTGMPAPALPSASAREAAARLLHDRVQSGTEQPE